MSKIKETKGYVLIETVIVRGIVIGIGGVAYMAFQNKSDGLVENSSNIVEEANDTAVVNNPFK